MSTVSLGFALEQPQTKRLKVDTSEAGIATEDAFADIDGEDAGEAIVYFQIVQAGIGKKKTVPVDACSFLRRRRRQRDLPQRRVYCRTLLE